MSPEAQETFQNVLSVTFSKTTTSKRGFVCSQTCDFSTKHKELARLAHFFDVVGFKNVTLKNPLAGEVELDPG